MQANQVQEVFSDLIDLPERQMRHDVDRDELHDLAADIKVNGLISPITVRPVGPRFELVAGQRRLLAMRINGTVRIPCFVQKMSDAEAVAIMASENLARRDVDLVDESRFIAQVMEGLNLSVEQMAERIRHGVPYVEARLLVAQMPDYMQNYLKTGELKLGVALALLKIEPEEKRRVWVGLAVQDSVSVRTAEYWVYQHKLGTLPQVVISPEDVPTVPGVEAVEPMFRCAVDGKEYPMSACQSVFIFRGNMGTLSALRDELGRGGDEVLVPVGGDSNAAAVAA